MKFFGLPDYRSVWRWHFFASLFCMPLLVVLSISGGIYLFKPQIEDWIYRDVDRCNASGQSIAASEQVHSAMESMLGARFVSFEAPRHPEACSRVVLEVEGKKQRVFVNPYSGKIIATERDDGGFIRQIRTLHGQLFMGERGSNVVEIIACWTVVMILTGLFLWWPRKLNGISGVLIPRFRAGLRILLRDLHAVTGFWIAILALFLITSGLPWAKFWGNYFRSVRTLTGTASAKQDWTMGGKPMKESEEHAGHSMERSKRSGSNKRDRGGPVEFELSHLDRVVESSAPYQLEYPAIFLPPSTKSKWWTAKSDTQNRPYRITLEVDGVSGKIMKKEGFQDRHWIDQIIAIGIAAHEGQLFGWLNQLLGLITVLGLILLSGSGYWMWWRRRKPGTLGVPAESRRKTRSWVLLLAILALCVAMPLFGLTLAIVALLDWTVIGRIRGRMKESASSTLVLD